MVGVVDRPGGRKQHHGDIPVVVGIAMFVGMFVGMFFFKANMTVFLLAQGVMILLMIYGDGQQLFDIGDPFGIGIISTELER